MLFYAVKHLKFSETEVSVLLVMLYMCDLCLHFFNPLGGITNRKWNSVPCSVTLNWFINFSKTIKNFYGLNGYTFNSWKIWSQILYIFDRRCWILWNLVIAVLWKLQWAIRGQRTWTKVGLIVFIPLFFWFLLTVELVTLVWNSS
jgi:hypothetical protein